MNNKDLKNRLKSEIESITPRVYDNVVQSSYIEKPVAKTKKAGASKAFRIVRCGVRADYGNRDHLRRLICTEKR
mgnify:CR=1 FL=1